MQHTSHRFVAAAVLAAAAVALAACGAPPETAAAPPYAITATIKDLMQGMIDINADVVWLAVSSVHTDKGIVETVPRNEEEWTNVRHGAIVLAEAANLLMMPGRPVARPGEKSETPGVELEPEEMDALINEDRDSWNSRALALHEAANAALAAIDARDPDKLFEVGEQIELACEGCHTQYWYPNEVIPPVEISVK
jgi:hypothetical protein